MDGYQSMGLGVGDPCTILFWTFILKVQAQWLCCSSTHPLHQSTTSCLLLPCPLSHPLIPHLLLAYILLRAQSSALRLDKPGPHQAVSKDMENVEGLCKLEITTVRPKHMANTCELPSYQRTVLNDFCNFFLLLLNIAPCAIIAI